MAFHPPTGGSGSGTVTDVTSTDTSVVITSSTTTPDLSVRKITVADAGGDTTTFPMLAGSATGVLQPLTDAGLSYNATTNTLTASIFSGALLGVATSATDTVSKTGTGSTYVTNTSPTITTPTLNGTTLLAEGASIGLDPAGSADGAYSGITITATAGYTQSFGDLVYIDPTDSRWEAADANSAAGADGDARGMLGMVVVPGTDGTACTILLQGMIRADAKFPTFTVNNPIYVSETAGAVTQTQPTTTDVVIRIVGAAMTTDEMYFNPDFTYITHT